MGADLTKLTATAPIPKHPNEDFVIGMDFSKVLDIADSIDDINEISISPTTEDMLTVVSEGVDPDNDQIILLRLGAGFADIDYKVTVTVETTLGNLKTGVGIVEVRTE